MVVRRLKMTKRKQNTMAEVSEQKFRKFFLKDYLKKIKELTTEDVQAEQLVDLPTTSLLKKKAIDLEECMEKHVYDLKSDEYFEAIPDFVGSLFKAYSGPVTVWIEESSICGPVVLESILNFNFKFDQNKLPEEVISILSTDAREKLVLDFDSSYVEIEIFGDRWSKVSLANQ